LETGWLFVLLRYEGGKVWKTTLDNLNTLNIKEKTPNFENSFIYENEKTPDTAYHYEIKKNITE